MSDALPGTIAQLRRLYLHLLSGASITPDDLSRVIAKLEGVQTDPLGLTTLKSEVDALHARVVAMRESVVGGAWCCKGCGYPPDACGCLAAVEMCECGVMTAVNCGELPSLRHCGKWDE